ncbi:pullulanase 1, chloroplastic isoform X2 [Phoenix dactylifera]|uniref:Pullulanase 1, chloroplastic isoform X2 n=1 Tax=Phoenix dactylifera TaxID=42345 RepID=A0A8B9A6H1_PHODC|nr:pullulanase 1, chloroplastic isoform X2 [Phoenix dactylifera]
MSSLSSPSPLLLHRPLVFAPSPPLRHISPAIPKPSSPPPSARAGARLSRRSRGRTISSCSLEPAPMERTSIAEVSLPQDLLSYARAYWVARFLIAWNINDDDDACVYLYASRKASIFLTDEGIEGYDVKILLEPEYNGLPANVTEKFPHIVNYRAFKISQSVDIGNLLKCQLAAAFYVDGKCENATGLQLPGVLDDLFAYNGPLGAVFSKAAVTLYLWAPTAQEVSVCVYEDPLGGEPVESVQLEEFGGVWSAVGPRSWEGCYYVYEVSVYHPSTSRIEKSTVNDPYARGLSSNGKRTWLVNLDSENLKPEGWDKLADEKPGLLSFSDISIYELHIRDFSASDYTVNCDIRGGYLAFTSQESAGIYHLKKLSNAGLTHVHLLPSFHFAGVDDDKSNWKYLDDGEMAKLPADSDKQQAVVTAIQDEDGYNWGYNPVLWGVPKGSYSGNPNGPSRILEFRKMIQAVNRIGLRVVLDVVYNHLAASGPLDENSVLDKVVPGYYLRRNTDGVIENSACMNNTASEHFMVEHLILDDLLNWAVAYKVDGFRFDLMGHIMKRTMVKARSTLQSLSKEKDGVDGPKIYIYGEGWDFGEVAKNKRGINASQFNICGTGIGSFNDRIRDAVLGGSPFGHPLQQGFVTGLSLEPNGYDHGDKSVTDRMLSASADHIQVGLAANLRDFVLTNHEGKAMKGSEVLTHDGVPVGYALSPTETVNYVSAHDNETLFDIISLKTALELSVDDRCRINHLASSLVALSQGIPFFHSGDELLRSKSLDRDSYDSGDWFNRLDFSFESNNWGVGLPPREKNEKNWPLIKPRLANPSFKPHKHHILAAVDNFVDLLKIRYSSPLFRLMTTNAIQERVRFHNTGPSWVPGAIVMSVEDGHEGRPGMAQLDPIYSYIVIVFNACPTKISLQIPALKSRMLQLHPVQLKSADELVKESSYEAASGCFTIPRRTTSVFVEVRGA